MTQINIIIFVKNIIKEEDIIGESVFSLVGRFRAIYGLKGILFYDICVGLSDQTIYCHTA